MRILFIGNSYTYFNDLPDVFRKICLENGIEAEVDAVTAGGYTLAHFVSETNPYGIQVREKCKSGPYDYAVIQEQSTRPAVSPKTFYKYLRLLLPTVRASGALPVLYETWGRADGADVLVKHHWTHEQMQAKLRAAYEAAGAEHGIPVAHAGDRFSEAYRAGVNVFDPDGSHPSPAGTEIAAREIFQTIIANPKP
ncbi:MAG: SGNH/GDSL hydrolase family protein [Clostridia bacterium]|nr:SGNH/GDSL hydrolase family protein [Clostridia bacterium]